MEVLASMVKINESSLAFFKGQLSFYPTLAMLLAFLFIAVSFVYILCETFINGFFPFSVSTMVGSFVMSLMIIILIIHKKFKIDDMISSLGVKEINGEDLCEKYNEIVEASGVKRAEVQFHVVKSEALNAYAVSPLFHRKRHIILTNNLLEELNEREIISIIGHELSHVKNRDGQFKIFFLIGERMKKKTGVLFMVCVLFIIVLFLMQKSIPLSIILLLFLFPLFILAVLRKIERNAEFKADLFSCKLTGSFDSMISALEKISSCEQGSTSHWLDTHPSFLERKTSILKMNGGKFDEPLS